MLISTVFSSIICGDRTIFEVRTIPRNFDCMMTTGILLISVFTLLFLKAYWMLIKIHVEKLPGGLPGCKLLNWLFCFLQIFVLGSVFGSVLSLFFLIFSLLPELLLMLLSIFPDSDLNFWMVFPVTYWSYMSVNSLSMVNLMCPKLKSYFSFHPSEILAHIDGFISLED